MLCRLYTRETRKKKMEGELGIFEAPKTMKTLVHVYNTILLVLGISKEDFKVFKNKTLFSVHCNRVFYKFPG